MVDHWWAHSEPRACARIQDHEQNEHQFQFASCGHDAQDFMLGLEPPYCHTTRVEKRSEDGYQAHLEVGGSIAIQKQLMPRRGIQTRYWIKPQLTTFWSSN